MTIENLNSRTGQSAKMHQYMLSTHSPQRRCDVMDGVFCKSYSPATNIGVESALIQGEISKAVERKPIVSAPVSSAASAVSRKAITSFESKEPKSVKSEQVILDRIHRDILPSGFNNIIPRNELFGIDTRSVIKYS